MEPKYYVASNGLIDSKPEKIPDKKQVNFCLEFLSRYATKTKTIRKNRPGSYGMKHIVERWAGEYISNGAFIQAALDAGFRIKRHRDGGLNCDFNMVPRDVDWNKMGARLRKRDASFV